MSQSSVQPGGPVDRIWLETLREFGRPVAVLAQPPPGWRRLVGQGSADGHLQRLDLAYGEESAMQALVQVTTQRRLPEHVRVFSTLEPDALLVEFLSNYSSHSSHSSHSSYFSLDGSICLPHAPTPGTGRLVVDGTVIEAQQLTYGGYLATLAAIGAETIAVVSTAALHGQAVHLTFDTSGTPA